MDLYIANGTRQIQAFMYRLPEVTQPRQQTIHVGGQIKISGDLNQKDIDAIIAQHRKYGLIEASEIDSGRSQAPLAWQVGRPISPDRIQRLISRNDGIMVERGRQARKDAAVVAATTLGSNLREQNVPGELNELEIGMTEERSRSGKPDSEMTDETIVVNRETDDGSAPRTARGRTNARKQRAN